MVQLTSKKIAIFLCALLLLATSSSMGIIFTILSPRAESVLLAASAENQRIERELAYRQLTGRRLDDRFTRANFAALSAEATSGANVFHVGHEIPVFARMGDYEPFGTYLLHIVEVLERQGNWKRVRSLLGEKWIYVLYIPEEVLLHVPGFHQQALGLPTGCEIVALAMVINKYVEVCVFDLVDEMPRNYDPLLGFRGNPFERGGFTILPPALLELTTRHIGSAVDMTGASIEEVQAQLASGRPVLAWLNGMFGFNVHVITLTGYNRYGFFYNDPWLGGVNEFITYAAFLAMWEDPIFDRWFNRFYPPRIAMSY